ncbi:sensor histidine kinase [Rhodobacter sp. NSM]|uniref:sensor histidine kinase n=1 Tax=Rhodobacter sp. NSM TaxID=3457501 RepID=UPI003FD42DC6
MSRTRTERRGHSIRRRMLALIATGFLVLLCVNSALLWTYAGRAADDSYDLLLHGAVRTILDRTAPGPSGPTVDLPPVAMEILALAPRERVVYRVFSPAYGEITGTPDLPLPASFEPSDRAVFYDARYDGDAMRFAVQGRMLTSPGGRTWVEVQVGQTREARLDQLLSLFLTGMAGVVLVSVIGLGFVWLAISQALKPLVQVEAELKARHPRDMSELRGLPPVEIEGLIGSINGFIARARDSRALTESFIADVAHQTRTSLSALQGQLSLATDARDFQGMHTRLVKAERQAERVVRLTNQLLAHAMVIHRSDEASLHPVAMTPLVRDLLAEMLRDTRVRGTTFTFDVDDFAEGGDVILGDEVSLREAIRNLIENALRHGPPDNLIDIDLRREGSDAILLSVSDAGPGIPEADRPRALERFTSIARVSAGSGLGLAIVKAVAEGHRASLRLETSRRGGLKAILTFPRLVTLMVMLWLGAGAAPAAAEMLRISSATDRIAVAPLIAAFERLHPGVTVAYDEFQTTALYDGVLEGSLAADLVISPAMDLQVDLVNRGLAIPLDLPEAGRLPPWASWRSELFGFTFEPAAIIYSRATFAADDLPATHQELASFIRAREDELRGRIGVYDLSYSGIGYLYATQEAEFGLDAARMNETLGRAGARTFCCTSEMIAATARGDLAMALNVIGSYALTEETPGVGVHLLDDYNLVMTRTAFVPRTAANPELGARFLTFLLSDKGQRLIVTGSRLLPILPVGTLETPALRTIRQHEGAFLPIRLGPGLLTYLDRLKRARFLSSWEAALRPSP